MNFDQIITNSGYFLLILNTLVFIIYYNKKDKALKYFIMYLILCLFIQLFSSFLSAVIINNLFLSHYFFIGQFLFLSLFYSKLYHFKKFKFLNYSFIFVVVLSLILYLSNFPETLKKWNVIEISITSIPLLIYSFFFFLKKVDDNKDKKYIYFNAGYFLYTLCSTLIFTLGNIGTRELKFYVWQFNAILYLIFQVMILVEWYKNFRKKIN